MEGLHSLGAAGIMLLLLISGLLVFIPARASAEQPAGLNWDGPWNNNMNWNNSPQTAISPSNVGNVQVAWLFPFPTLPDRRSTLIVPGYVFTPQGPGNPPIIHQGILYEETEANDIYAFDAGSGKVLWHFVYPLADNAPGYHTHAIKYYNGMIWETVPGPDGWGGIIGVDAINGDLKVNITDIYKNIPGQHLPASQVQWEYGPEWPPAFYKNIALVQFSTTDLDMRGFFAAYDINTGRLLWRWYTTPPGPNCDPNWDFKQVVDLGNGTTVNYGQPTGNVSPYRGDWGTDCTQNGAAGPWDSPAVDNETGTFYVQTSSPYPVGWVATRPGPNLWGDSIVSLDAATGKMNWFFQATTRDVPGELDCQWSAMLITVNGQKQIAVPCRNYLYGLNAQTGKLLWSYDPMLDRATGTNPTKLPTGTNMGDQTNLTEPFIGAPTGVIHYNTSINENAPAFDGKSTVFWFIGTYGVCNVGPPTPTLPVPPPPYFPNWASKSCTAAQASQYPSPSGSVLVAMDASTGKKLWSVHFGKLFTYRGGLTYTNGMILAGTADGNLYFIDATNGNIITTRSMGVALNYAPTIGTTADGKVMAFLPLGGGVLFGRVPGALVAFSLAASPSPIVTTTSVTTVVSTVSAPSTGFGPEVFYPVTALAAIFVVATGLLVVRRRKPAS